MHCTSRWSLEIIWLFFVFFLGGRGAFIIHVSAGYLFLVPSNHCLMALPCSCSIWPMFASTIAPSIFVIIIILFEKAMKWVLWYAYNETPLANSILQQNLIWPYQYNFSSSLYLVVHACQTSTYFLSVLHLLPWMQSDQNSIEGLQGFTCWPHGIG